MDNQSRNLPGQVPIDWIEVPLQVQRGPNNVETRTAVVHGWVLLC